MTGKQEIEKLLAQVPDEAVPQLVGFLRALTERSAIPPKPDRVRSKRASVAQQTFGLIQAPAEVVRQALADDFYDFE